MVRLFLIFAYLLILNTSFGQYSWSSLCDDNFVVIWHNNNLKLYLNELKNVDTTYSNTIRSTITNRERLLFNENISWDSLTQIISNEAIIIEYGDGTYHSKYHLDIYLIDVGKKYSWILNNANSSEFLGIKELDNSNKINTTINEIISSNRIKKYPFKETELFVLFTFAKKCNVYFSPTTLDISELKKTIKK